MSADLDLDPFDPLSSLLHNNQESSMDEDSTWKNFSTLWADHISMDFTDLGSVDKDFDPSMTVEPSALHYDYAKLAQSMNYTDDQFNAFNTELLPPQPGCTDTFIQQKLEPSQINATTYANYLAVELAQRVRQSADAMVVIPVSSSPKSSSSSSTASTPPPSTPPAAVNVPTAAHLRPKTSHTTIERRYRTNLNARIQSLRMAVPALRVLEDMGTGKKIKKNVKGGVVVKGSGIGIIESDDGSVIDVIDERGFVDGVKVARKCSKANVLGKAVEYIRVLKKREHRLKAEQAGLKTLINGFVGGPALVKEWEREWKAKFGGEEQDEVEGEDEEGDDDDSDEEEGEEGEEELGKKRKRPKTSPTVKVSGNKAAKKSVSPVVVPPNDQVPEKRKRGRPRKVLPSTMSAASGSPASSDHQILPSKQDETIPSPTSFSSESQWVQHQQPQPQQFLLAVFALFSFFNSPLTSPSVRHDHSHTGTVLNSLHPPLAYAPDIISQFTPPSTNNISSAWSWQDYIHMFHLLVSVMVLVSFVGSWLGISFGFGFKKPVSVRGSLRDGMRQGVVDWVKMGEQNIIEGKAASLSLYERVQIYRSVSRNNDMSVSDLATLALIAGTTSGVLSGLGRMKARSVWATAQDLTNGIYPKPLTPKINERLVFETWSVDEALDRLALTSVLTKQRADEDGRIHTPLQVLACLIVKERVKKHVGKLFVQAVIHPAERAIVKDEEEREEEARRMTVDSARELGGSVEKLGKAFERVWKTASVEDDDLSSFLILEGDDIKALFTALVLYRRVFGTTTYAECGPSSALLSPPPSPIQKTSVKHAQMLLELRKALGNTLFEDADVEGECDDMEGGYDLSSRAFRLEDARDRVVDMIVDVERRERGVSPDNTPY